MNSDGTVGKGTYFKKWQRHYEGMCVLTIGDRNFICAQSDQDNFFFVQELKSDGTLGRETCNAKWGNFFTSLF